MAKWINVSLPGILRGGKGLASSFLIMIGVWAIHTTAIAQQSALPVFTVDSSARQPVPLRDIAQYFIFGGASPWSGNAISQKFNAKQIRQYSKLDDVHWLRFSLRNSGSEALPLYLNVMFTDSISLYKMVNAEPVLLQQSGDLTGLRQREVKTGEMVIMNLLLDGRAEETYWLRLESRTPISRQFKARALRSVNLFTRPAYEERFIEPRVLQALFFGALIIMLLYNFFIYTYLKKPSYAYYLLFLALLIVFMASNAGYLLEIALPSNPRLDLYIRFLSTPLVLFSYLQFSRYYLRTKENLPVINRLLLLQIAGVALPLGIMLLGYWSLGRDLVIPGAIMSMVTILAAAITLFRKKYQPARYFLAANLLLLIGSVIFAFQKYLNVLPDMLTHYSLQIAVVAQVSLLSLALADRINFMRSQLLEKQRENEVLDLRRKLEIQQLTERTNQELSHKVKEATHEIQEQKDNIEKQNKDLAQAQKQIWEQNRLLININQHLEDLVDQRTAELAEMNLELREKVKELDAFIYRTSHDIRGPLARLMGLCHLALGEITDAESRDYFEKMNYTALELNYILVRLINIYQISQKEIVFQKVELSAIADKVIKDLGLNANDSIKFIYIKPDNEELATDSKMLFFILLALLENAAKYGKEGNSDPQVQLELNTVDETTTRIFIRDNGRGIDGNLRGRLFELFAKGSGSKGAGLGLYMCRVTAQRLGGAVTYNGKNTEGMTEFCIHLPKNVTLSSREAVERQAYAELKKM